jgi:hydrogenase nickel incorporation protein HypA/HybF
MHELSVARAVVRTVLDAVGDDTVDSVEVSVGALSGVAPSALEFCWDIATAGTSLAGSGLQITQVPTSVYCHPCGQLVEPETGLCCPRCDQPSPDLRSGRELLVLAARVRDRGSP